VVVLGVLISEVVNAAVMSVHNTNSRYASLGEIPTVHWLLVISLWVETREASLCFSVDVTTTEVDTYYGDTPKQGI
jgi:hypothetical protein